MDTLQDRVQDTQLERLEADLAACMDMLFRRCPVLCGFSVQEGEHLLLSDLACHPAIDGEQAMEVCELILNSLLELMEEQPEAMELLRGRTFARVVH